MTSTIAFPSASTATPGATSTDMSVASVSRHATAVEVCDFVYGDTDASSSLDQIQRFYEADAIYENPFVTATSRSVIRDIYSLTRQLSHLDIPRPLAMFCTLFRIKPPDVLLGKRRADGELERPDEAASFQALRVWTEVGDISESESFDGHRRSVVEHTLNILLLPGIHSDRHSHQPRPSSSSVHSDSLSVYTSPSHHPVDPALLIPGTRIGVPSPLHLQLHIMTRLSFNEQGRITHHRDLWDVKDVLGLVPGVSLAQWITGRLAASGLSFAARVFGAGRPRYGVGGTVTVDLESAPAEPSPADAYRLHAADSLGLDAAPRG